jgi:hypothetical protein
MDANWYYSSGGKQAGPVSSADLNTLASSGQLLPTDMVWKEGMQSWVPANRVKGLFNSIPVASGPPSLPPTHPLTNPAKTPAITLIVAGGILATMALFNTVFALCLPQPQPTLFSDGDAASKLMILKALLIIYGIVPLALSGIVIYGGIAMLNCTNYAWSMAAAISAIVGGVLSMLLGWVFVAPIGIWALIVLRKPEVKQRFPTANWPTE